MDVKIVEIPEEKLTELERAHYLCQSSRALVAFAADSGMETEKLFEEYVRHFVELDRVKGTIPHYLVDVPPAARWKADFNRRCIEVYS